MSRMSSTAPRPTIAVQARSAASGSALSSFMNPKNGNTRETPRPTRSPTYIASPPIVGVGDGWTLRSEG